MSDEPFMTTEDYDDLVERYGFVNFTGSDKSNSNMDVVTKSGDTYRARLGENNILIFSCDKHMW